MVIVLFEFYFWFFLLKRVCNQAREQVCYKVSKALCLECSALQIFLSWSFMVSIMGRFLSNILSLRIISTFFILLRMPVIRCIPSSKSIAARFFEIYPLSEYKLPNIRLRILPSFNGCLSSTFPWVITKSSTSPLSFTIKCSLKPWNHPMEDFPVVAIP